MCWHAARVILSFSRRMCHFPSVLSTPILYFGGNKFLKYKSVWKKKKAWDGILIFPFSFLFYKHIWEKLVPLLWKVSLHQVWGLFPTGWHMLVWFHIAPGTVLAFWLCWCTLVPLCQCSLPSSVNILCKLLFGSPYLFCLWNCLALILLLAAFSCSPFHSSPSILFMLKAEKALVFVNYRLSFTYSPPAWEITCCHIYFEQEYWDMLKSMGKLQTKLRKQLGAKGSRIALRPVIGTVWEGHWHRQSHRWSSWSW